MNSRLQPKGKRELVRVLSEESKYWRFMQDTRLLSAKCPAGSDSYEFCPTLPSSVGDSDGFFLFGMKGRAAWGGSLFFRFEASSLRPFSSAGPISRGDVHYCAYRRGGGSCFPYPLVKHGTLVAEASESESMRAEKNEDVFRIFWMGKSCFGRERGI